MKLKSFNRTGWLLACSSMISFSSAAFADDSADNNTEASDITVLGVAERGLNLQKPSGAGSRLDLTSLETPASVAVVSGDTIRNWGIDTIAAATTRAPGITAVPFAGTGNNAMSMRGFYGTNSIAQTYDGVQLFNAGGVISFPFDTWNVERIEVLYGPASILYGTGAIGGAINVVTKAPDPMRSSQQLQLAYGSYNTLQAAADLTGPLAEGLSFRANASYRRSDGWMERGDSRSFAGSLALRYEASPELALTITDDFGDIEPSTYEGTPLVNGKIDERLRFKNYNTGDAQIRFRENRLRGTVAWSPSEQLTFRNDVYWITSYRRYYENYIYTYVPTTDDVTRSGYRDILARQQQVGDHGYATWRAPVGGFENELVVGFDLNRNTYDRSNNTTYSGSSTVDAINFDPGTYASVTGETYRIKQYDATLDQLGAFVQDRLKFSEVLSVVAGLRYDRYRTIRDDALTGKTTRSDVLKGTGWHVGAVAHPIRDVSLYAQYATASDPVTSLASISASQQIFQLSPARQIEVGAKGSFLNGRVEATLSAYRIVKRDVLTPTIDNPSVSEQVGQQSSNGIEASLAARPARGWLVEANGTILRAKFDEFVATVGGKPTSLKGKIPQFVPQRTASLRSTLDLTPAIQVRGELQYVGRRYSDNANLYELKAYTLANFGLRWLALPNLKFDLRVDNAFDKIYAASTYAGSGTQVILGSPRTATAGISAAF